MYEISLMFAVEAEQLLLAGMPEEAIELCKKGLEVYPGYAAAVSVMARSYSALGDRNTAVEIIQNEESNLPAPSFKNIRKSIYNSEFSVSNTESENSKIEFSDDNQIYDISENIEYENDFKTENVSDIYEENISDQEISESNNELHETVKNSDSKDSNIYDSTEIEVISNEAPKIDDLKINDFSLPLSKLKSSELSLIPGLDRFATTNSSRIFGTKRKNIALAIPKIIKKQSTFVSIMKSIENAEPIRPDGNHKPETKTSPVMVTDTIAGILVQQGAYSEAKKAYTTLMERHPDKKQFYLDKIHELSIKH